MWATITKPFAWLMIWLYDLTGSYGFALILFGLVVNLILTPFMAKSKKSTMRTTRLQPQLQELQKRHEGNPQKLQEETQKLYREEGINPMSGCLWSFIPFPILIALYSVIRQPLTRMMGVGQDVVTALQNFFVNQSWYTIPTKTDAYAEIKLVNIMHDHWTELQQAITSGNSLFSGLDLSGLRDFDFNFLGLNLGATPDWKIWTFDTSSTEAFLTAFGLFMIPVIAAFLSWLSMKVSNMSNPQTDERTQASMKSMALMMPLMSLWFCFIMPASMGIYWISNSVFGMARDYILTKVYKKQLDIEDAERREAREKRARELELNRLETERKHAEGISEVNENTSKKKQKASEKQKSNERKAALDREDRAARRELLGIAENEVPASQVGNRRYARGRAYDPNRFGTAPAEESPVAESSSEEETPAAEVAAEKSVTSVAEETIASEVTASVTDGQKEASADIPAEEVKKEVE